MGTDKNLTTVLRELCANGPITYSDYINCVLYTQDLGYYTRPQPRVGRDSKRDFYTAESLGSVFAQLVTTAANDLLGCDLTQKSTFVEIAAEPGTSLLKFLDKHPFTSNQTIRQNDPQTIKGPSVIFANEWLDALPFHRIRFSNDKWRERGVNYDPETGHFTEVLLNQLSDTVLKIAHRLPKIAPDGYEIDLPIAAESKLHQLLNQDWTGLILLFDYGKSWKALTSDYPEGTARTYHKHQRDNNLLDQPGEKDITCDVCWDPLCEILEKHNFQSITLESQESFLVKRAGRAASDIISANAGQFSEAKQTLMELMHPSHMGQRFQVLWAIR